MTSKLAQSAAQINVLLSQYLNDENTLHLNLPFIVEAITLNNVLSSGLDHKNTETKNNLTDLNYINFSSSSYNTNDSSTQVDLKTLKGYYSALDKWASRLTALILSKQPKVRLTSAILIKQTCEQSNRLLFLNFEKWSLHLINLLSKPEPNRTHQVVISAIVSILDKLNYFTDMQKDFVIPTVIKFNLGLISLLNSNQNLLPKISFAFIWIAKTHPLLLRSNFQKILKALTPFLGGKYLLSQPSLITNATECISELSIISGKDSASERWKETVLKAVGSTVNTLHKAYYSVDIYHKSTLQDCFELENFDQDYIRSLPLMINRCVCLTELLISLLTMETKEPITIPIQEIIYLIILLSSVNNKTKKSDASDTQEYNILQLLVPKLYMLATRIIAALVISLNEHLIPYIKLLMQASIKLHLQSKNNREVKSSSYAVITLLCEKYGYGSTIYLGSDFFKDVLSEFEFNKNSSEINNLSCNANQIQNKNLKRKNTSNNYFNDGMKNSLVTEIYWTELHFAALDTISVILKNTPANSNQQLREKIEKIVIELLLTLGNSNESNKLSFYDDYYYKTKVYICLYQLLIILISRPVYNRPNILSIASNLFISGISSYDLEIVKICKAGLEVCESVIHPKLPFLSKPNSAVFNPSIIPHKIESSAINLSKNNSEHDQEFQNIPKIVANTEKQAEETLAFAKIVASNTYKNDAAHTDIEYTQSGSIINDRVIVENKSYIDNNSYIKTSTEFDDQTLLDHTAKGSMTKNNLINAGYDIKGLNNVKESTNNSKAKDVDKNLYKFSAPVNQKIDNSKNTLESDHDLPQINLSDSE
ncbi:hypothetical protein BB561_003579 [Smittium simulii]|uniref:Pre-rRNA-processing protein RIX1 n=1 Tax=Smittium simulii TaxID=133385 RepID=A0A2T9YKI3_9FUNG|nr:hypothetical protein BB561_003579 [Smittium simulii]